MLIAFLAGNPSGRPAIYCYIFRNPSISTKEAMENLHRTETASKASKFPQINVPSVIMGNQNSAICHPALEL
jgi:hypothetical protein